MTQKPEECELSDLARCLAPLAPLARPVWLPPAVQAMGLALPRLVHLVQLALGEPSAVVSAAVLGFAE